MIALSMWDGHALGKKRTDRQFVCGLSFESVDKLDNIHTS